ncbi:BON domain-containing protein [Roseateles chitosanitabidus]|jgi:osmotically-inducible protein OsmY|uniref:BON domain-containing protein n=1 Tax=Roseateles chitosanitabidus TaxID=65048 RepID=UPI000834F5EF|nr:BON domain-containing protein [Roseateles chitosanitabidus]MBO9688909.1 BON domain-containing protein [Roseateles chitosanitabidus]
MQRITRPHSLALLLPAVVAAVALTACGREDDDRTAGQRLDAGISKMEQKSDQAAAETRQAADEMGKKMERAADKAGVAVDDAQITTSIKTALAGDPKLSALDVKVETEHGHVTLDGKAPDLAARDRAGSMALATKGVQSVNNRIKVSG